MTNNNSNKTSLPPLGGNEGGLGGCARFSIAKDPAFNFTYRANIDALRELGEVVMFSPLADERMPECDMLYLPGGYPELFAQELSANTSMRQSIKDFAERGGRIFAECGGFMYLCQTIDGIPMCGVLPLDATMSNARLHLGYRVMDSMRGHEFHYSDVIPHDIPGMDIDIIQSQLTAKGKPVSTPIYRYKNVIAGYTHWYWAETGFISHLRHLFAE